MVDETNPPEPGSSEDQAPEEDDTMLQNLSDEVLPEELDQAVPASGGSRSRGSTAGSPLEAERDSYREMAQRIQADFENYKKRVAKQEQELRARAEESLVIKLLPVLDTIDLALAHDPNGSLEQVRGSLLEVLEKAGLERVADLEAAFDPTMHEAVMHEPGDGEQRVSDVMRAGYRWNGRVVRPAMVKVIGS
jgi:molecular chaperone GrpE